MAHTRPHDRPVDLALSGQAEKPTSRIPWRWLIAIIPFSIMLLLSWRGSDFGKYWDEDFNKISAVSYSIDNNFTLLPDSYIYPGVNYWLTVACLAPELTDLAMHDGLTAAKAKPVLLTALHKPGFRIRERRLYSFIASLTPVWVYFLILVWRQSWSTALVGSLLVALSGEVIYHSRWIAADSIVMQFGALTMFLVFLFWKRGQHAFLYAASVSAALACGAKYPGGLLLAPVECAIWLTGSKPSRRLRMTIASLSLFIGVYLLTTPGTVLQPFKFYESIQIVKGAYGSGWYGYTVHSGLPHLWKIIVYFATQLFSTNPVLSVVAFLFVPVGVIAVILGLRKEALILLVFPILYLAYFSQQRAMVVRNYLVVVPFVAALAAAGVESLQRRIPKRPVYWGLMILIAGFFLTDTVQQFQASTSILNRKDTDRFVREFIKYVDSNQTQHFLVSPALESRLRQQGFWADNLISQKQVGLSVPFDQYASYYSETVTPRQYEWITNRPGTFSRIFGPREVNLAYYVGWPGDDRIVVLTKRNFYKWKVDKPPVRTGP